MASIPVSSVISGNAATPAVVDTGSAATPAVVKQCRNACRICEWEEDCPRCNINIARWRTFMFMFFFEIQKSRTFAIEHGDEEPLKKRIRFHEQLAEETSDEDGRFAPDFDLSGAESSPQSAESQ